MASRRVTKILRVGAVIAVCVAAAVGVAYWARLEIFRRHVGLPPFDHPPGHKSVHWVPMVDGVKLHTDVFVPGGDGPWPTLVMRSPYESGLVFPFLCEVATRYGYACIHQFTRGCGVSEGEWTPLENERADGLATLAWLREQPFTNKRVALVGTSYLAAAAWLVADAAPPEVKTLVILNFSTDLYSNNYEGGAFRHDVTTAWASLMPDGHMHFDNEDVYVAMLATRPHVDAPREHLGQPLAWYDDIVRAPWRGDPYWNQPGVRQFAEMPANVEVPVLMIGGWYDTFFGGQLRNFQALATRESSRFGVGPWTHLHETVGPVQSDIAGLGMLLETKDWLAHQLRGAAYDRTKGGMKLYEYGADTWWERSNFPSSTATVALFLHPDGQLRRASSTETATKTFVYDPTDPAPTRGGAALLAYAFRTYDAPEPGPHPVDDACARSDVLCFSTEPARKPIRVDGPIRAELTVASSAPDSAFTINVLDVAPDGVRRPIRDTIRSLRHRLGDDRPASYVPGARVKLELETWPIAWTVPVGHRLLLEVSSSNFPSYHAHPNLSVESWALADRTTTARQSLVVGEKQSVLRLAVKPLDTGGPAN